MIYIEDVEPHFSITQLALLERYLFSSCLGYSCLLELRRYTWRIIFGICMVLFIIGRCYN
jgi:hypothetical protein